MCVCGYVCSGGKFWTRSSPQGHFHAVFGKFWPNNRLAPPTPGIGAPILEILDPPRMCVCVCVCVCDILLVIHSLQHIQSEEIQLFLLGKLSKFKHNMRKSKSTRDNFFSYVWQ